MILSAAPLCAADAPRLAVVIAVDQLRYDYLERFRPYFGPDGFNRLLTGGANFVSCHHRHAVTKTACGHAALITGVYADVHGIIGNEWLDPQSFEAINAVEDRAAPLVGAGPASDRSPGALLEAKAGRSPRNLLAGTIGDQLKFRFGAASRVVSIANKDRASILMGGKLADQAFWIEQGRFVSSAYYLKTLPAWAEAFNNERRTEKSFGREWSLLLEPTVYAHAQAGPDLAEGELDKWGLGRTFPRRIDGGEAEISPAFYEAFEHAPFYSDVLADFAETAVKAEQLGRHAAPDLLCIGFAQIDHAGHVFGPDSWEMMDSMVRLDRTLARLLQFLDTEVGRDRYLVVLTADHGVAPLPERLQALRTESGASRFEASKLDAAVDTALNAAFGLLPQGEFWAVREGFSYRLRPEALAARGVTRTAAASAIAQAVTASPQVAAAFTREELMSAPAEGDSVLAMSRRSYFPARSPDAVFVLAPYVVDRRGAGTNHGTPWDYDTHVPLVWYGPGVPTGVFLQRVGMEQLAPTLAAALGVPPPPQSTAERLF